MSVHEENIDQNYHVTIPDQIGHYKYISTIDYGSYSVVVLVSDINTGQEYACKVCSRQQMVDYHMMEQFEREIRVIQQLDHPNLVKLYDIVYEEHNIYLIMDYCSDGDLLSYLIRNGKLPEFVARRVFSKILSGIHYMHTKGIIHRDIKLENILLCEYGEVKIADFGLCHEVNQEPLKTRCGSPLYIAPEILEGKKYDGKKSDIWSAGIALYAMVTGMMPWDVTTDQSVYNQIVKANIQIPWFLSPNLSDLLVTMLKREPAERPSTEELLKHPWVSGSMQIPRKKVKSFSSQPVHLTIANRHRRRNSDLMPRLIKPVSTKIRLNTPRFGIED